MTQDITDLLALYRNAARSLWNDAYWSQNSLRTWESYNVFLQIKDLLFRSVVLDQIEDDTDQDSDWSASLRVILRSQQAPVLINREPNKSHGNWDHIVDRIKRDDVTLVFVDYFDWNVLDYVDFQYYRVLVKSSIEHPEIAGHQALIDVHYARVMWVGADGLK